MSVTIDISENVALITMDDGKANAVSHQLLDALEPALDKAQRDAKAVVLTGRTGVFCGGFDLKVLQGAAPEEVVSLVNRGGRLAHRLYGFPIPVVAAAGGHGIALGALWLLAADTRVGAKGDFKFGLNETAIGMTLPVFGIELARARLDPTQLTAAAIQSKIYGVEGAVQAGFLDQVLAAEELIPAALKAAAQLGSLPGSAYLANKQAFRGEALARIESSLK